MSPSFPGNPNLKAIPQAPDDPRELCLICKQPEVAGRPGAVWTGQGDNAMVVAFYLHADCRPVLENRRGGRAG